jgi:hypothetical protein
MGDYYDLGTYSRLVTTSSAEAQVWFDRGLLWCYGYNHEESIRCFRKATEYDRGCAMAYWGIAYASGSNITSAGRLLPRRSGGARGGTPGDGGRPGVWGVQRRWSRR